MMLYRSQRKSMVRSGGNGLDEREGRLDVRRNNIELSLK
jgi:hypothetical protein